jgi:hypothetical protein
MSDAMKSIVDGYMSLKDRVSLEELRAHRLQLKKKLQEQSSRSFDPSKTIKLYDDDLQIIEAAISRLG